LQAPGFARLLLIVQLDRERHAGDMHSAYSSSKGNCVALRVSLLVTNVGLRQFLALSIPTD
jgi:hypothetical protein